MISYRPWWLHVSMESNCYSRGKRSWLFEKPWVEGEERSLRVTGLLWDPEMRSCPGYQQTERAYVIRKMCLQGRTYLSRPLKGALFFSSAKCLLLGPLGLHGHTVWALGCWGLPAWSGRFALRACVVLRPLQSALFTPPHLPASPNA